MFFHLHPIAKETAVTLQSIQASTCSSAQGGWQQLLFDPCVLVNGLDYFFQDFVILVQREYVNW